MAKEDEMGDRQRQHEKPKGYDEKRKGNDRRLRGNDKANVEQYWIDMDGVEFERELGSLFQTMGYESGKDSYSPETRGLTWC